MPLFPNSESVIVHSVFVFSLCFISLHTLLFFCLLFQKSMVIMDDLSETPNMCDMERGDATRDRAGKNRYQFTGSNLLSNDHSCSDSLNANRDEHVMSNSRAQQSPQTRNRNDDVHAMLGGVQNLITELRDSRFEARARENCQNVKRTKVMPDLYDGKTSWPEYLIHFESVAELNNWNAQERIQFLSVSLRGEACMAMQSLTVEERRNYEIFISSLSKRFNPGNRENLYRTQLRTRTRRDRESLSQLAQSVRNLAAQAYPSADRKLFESLCCDHFLDATGDSELRNMLCLVQPQRFDDMVSMAVQLEANRQSERNKQPRRYVRELGVSSPESQSVVQKGDISGACNFVEKTNAQGKMEDLLEKLLKLMEELKHRKQSSNFKKEYDTSKMKCFNCGEIGHIKNKCSKPQQGSEARAFHHKSN